MLAQDISINAWLEPFHVVSLALYFGVLYAVANLVISIYDAYYGPLSKFPGPKSRALSIVPKVVSSWRGAEHTDYIALHERYGPVVRIAPRELSYAGGAEAWKDIYGFKKHGQQGNAKPKAFYGNNFNPTPNILNADDADHSRQRKTVSHAFADKSLHELEPTLLKWAEKLKIKLAECTASGVEVDMLKYYNCTTFDIMANLTFGEGLSMLEEGEYSPWVTLIFSSIKRITQLRALKQLHPVIARVITRILALHPTLRHKQLEHWTYTSHRMDRRLSHQPTGPDLWTQIPAKAQGSSSLPVAEHHAIAALFMVAGTETTATALSGVTFHLLRRPRVLARLTSEIRTAYPASTPLTLDSLRRLPYLSAVLREGLRMYPPVPSLLPRETPKGGTVIAGEFVPGGTTVGVHQLAAYRSREAFHRAGEFVPERWMGAEATEFARDRLDVVEPFSVGPRNCLGRSLAWHEMRLLLATVLRDFDLVLCSERDDWVARQRVFMFWEKVPLMCRLTPVRG